MTATCATAHPTTRPAALRQTRGAFSAPHRTLARRLTGWIVLSRSRRQLAALTDAQLADIGLSRAQAQAEAARPVWDAPEFWRNHR